MTRVSVLVPAHNVAAYVSDTLRSISDQTFSDFEVIAVDDCSSDDTWEVLRSWPGRDPRVRVFRNDQNLGMTANWNRCLAEARSDLVIKLDADDWFRPRALEVLVEALSDDDVIAAGMRTLACDEDMNPFDGLPGDDALMRAGIDPYADATLDCSRWYPIAGEGAQPWHSCAIMSRRAFLSATGGYDERFGCASDTELVARTLEQPGKFAHRAYVGVLYRIRQASVSSVFRANDWLTWEGTVANLLSLHRFREAHGLPRRLRFHYAALWNRWSDNIAENRARLEIYPKLAAVMNGIEQPSLGDRIIVRARQRISALARRNWAS